MVYILSPERAFITNIDKFSYIDAPDFILDYLEESGNIPLGLDTETSGLDFIDDTMHMLQIGTLDTQFIIDTRHHDIEFLRPVLESKDRIKVLQNVKFDYKFIKKFSGIELEGVFDTMLSDKIINCGSDKPSSLQMLALRYLNRRLDKDIRMEFIAHTGPFTEGQIEYAALDVTVPLELYHKMAPILKREKLTRVMYLENRAVLAFADIEYNGIAIDDEKWLERSKVSKLELDRLKMNLDHTIESEERFFRFQDRSKQLDFFKDPDEISFVNINWGSPKQVLKIMQVDYPEIESVGADVLSSLQKKTDFLRTYLAYKKMAKLYSSYGPAFLEHKCSDNRIHTNFSQVLKTGRVSSAKPNMQQLPGDNSFRNCFLTGYDDWVFVSSDYSSQELCVIATIAKDPVWLGALREGKDLHSVCAALVYGNKWQEAAEEDCAFYGGRENAFKEGVSDYPMKKCGCKGHKKLRTNVKTINFGLAYGMSEYTLSDRLMISVDEARNLIEEYFTTFPKIRETLKKFGEFGKRNGYIMTMPPFRRKRYFRKPHNGDLDYGRVERASKNTPIQGSSADMTKVAMIYIRDYIKEYGLPVKMVMTVHDQIDTIVHKYYAEQWKEEMQRLMEKAALKIITNGLLKAETTISPVWQK